MTAIKVLKFNAPACLLFTIIFFVICVMNFPQVTFPGSTLEVRDFAEEALLSEGTKGLLKCADSDLEGSFKQRGHFYVLTNFVKARRKFRCHESITFAAPADFSFLDNLEPLVERWRGPVSVALYAPGYDFDTTMKAITYVRECSSPLIKELVSFHLFFEFKHLPVDISREPFASFDCSSKPPFATNKTYRRDHSLTFPINVARNVAKEESQTQLVIVADIELVPTPNLINSFFRMIIKRPQLVLEKRNRVFVLPIFEVPAGEMIPDSKTELQTMYTEQRAFIFHAKLCVVCHRVPQWDKWLKKLESGELDIFTKSKREGKYKDWEPFYIGDKDVPDFDERLSWEGQSNKMTQNYLMCLKEYEYMVLNDAFITHKPGIKKGKAQLREFGSIVRETNVLIKDVIVPEYNIIYGTKRGCHLK